MDLERLRFVCPVPRLLAAELTVHHRHDGLTRGTSHLKICASGHKDCKNSAPQLVRYDGYKHLQEPQAQIVSCIGPRGIAINESDDDAIWAYPGKAIGMLRNLEFAVLHTDLYRRC